MRLTDIDGHFFAVVDASRGHSRRVPSLEGAHGVRFQCPLCGQGKDQGSENGRRFIVGAHYIQVCFSNPRGVEVAPEAFDDSARWSMTGTSLDDLTTEPSINCDIPWKDEQGVEHPSFCKFHGYIRQGDAA